MSYDVYSKFDIQKHKSTYIDYLEVIIDPEGVVQYAVPSHSECLIRHAMECLCKTREEISDMCPLEYYCDFLSWLCTISGCMAVWTDFVVVPAIITDRQFAKLSELSTAGLYHGQLPTFNISE